ncbi:hypothetical protein BH10ACI2_BH10ACI2_19130 [soil metagenome]
MNQTAEQIFETIKVLPAEEREKLDRLMNAGRSNGSGNGATVYKNERFRKEQKWIHEHMEEYGGQFVLLEGDVLLGHGTDSKALYQRARDLGIKAPFVKRMKPDEEPFFGGW